jgi:hypothetical protein
MKAMMLVETGLTLANEAEKTEAWKTFYAQEENQSVVVTPALLGSILKDKLEKGGVHFVLDV